MASTIVFIFCSSTLIKAQNCKKWNAKKMIEISKWLHQSVLVSQNQNIIEHYNDFLVSSIPSSENCSRKILITNHHAIDTLIRLQDKRIPFIREAKNRLGIWKPIEYWTPAWCGQSNSRMLLRKQQEISFDIPQYTGSFRTKIRIRVTINEKYYYTKPYIGYINPGQFKKIKRTRKKN